MQTPQRAKIVLLGDRCVGKRTIISSGFDKPQRLSSLYIPIEFVDVELKSHQKVWNLQCYDSLLRSSATPQNETPSVEQFTGQVIAGADAILFCYAADDAESFRSVSRWYSEASVYFTPNTLFYLVETKADLQNKVNEHDFKDLTMGIKFENHFKICGLKKEIVLQTFTSIVERIESLRSLNSSQALGRNGTMSYSSPLKKKTDVPVKETKYSDKKEKIVIMEGSYVKRFGVSEKTKSPGESSVKLQPKHVDEQVFAEEF